MSLNPEDSDTLLYLASAVIRITAVITSATVQALLMAASATVLGVTTFISVITTFIAIVTAATGYDFVK